MSYGRKLQRRGLREELDAIHRDRAINGRKPRNPTNWGKVGESVFSKCGPNGERREHPNIISLRWLRFFGEALAIHGICADANVDATDWEKTGCVKLQLQEVALAEEGQKATALVNGIPIRATLKAGTPMASGPWREWPIPTGMLNNHDMRGVLKLLLAPRDVELVYSRNPRLQAINGL